MEFAVVAVFIVVIVAFFVIMSNRGNEYQKKEFDKLINEAKSKYDSALKSGDRQQALDAGREYYSLLRGGTPSVYDEQALTNDLSAMK